MEILTFEQIFCHVEESWFIYNYQAIKKNVGCLGVQTVALNELINLS